MTAEPGLDLEGYRAGLRGYLDNTTELDRWRDKHYDTTEAKTADLALLAQTLFDAGWSRYGWPESVGGHGGDPRFRALLYDELSARDLPIPTQFSLIETLGQPTLRFAPALAEQFLPAFVRGQEWWGQGFSEPEAGSDLASLRCRATRDGDRFVINGQKLWTSHGATANRLFCLMRTGTPESRHRGLTMFLIDRDTPGVDVRAVAMASGKRELAEMFFDNVVVPESRLVGPENGGWGVAMFLLQYERAMYAWLTACDLLRRLRVLRGQAGAPRDGQSRAFGRAYLDVVALRCRSAVTVRALAAGATVGPEASVDKVLLGAAEHSVQDTARELLWPGLELSGGAELDEWRDHWWYSRAATIFGGSAEVQRTILADHVMGLPREGAR
jgi:alkylation response protein AidB-like acyl-CoA dehydrogenase